MDNRSDRFEVVEVKVFHRVIPARRPITAAVRITLTGQKDHPLSLPIEEGMYLRTKMSVGEIGRDNRFHEGLPYFDSMVEAVSGLIAQARPEFERINKIAEDRFQYLSGLKRATEREAQGGEGDKQTRHTGKTERERQKHRAKKLEGQT